MRFRRLHLGLLWFAPSLAAIPIALWIWRRTQVIESRLLIGLAITLAIYCFAIANFELRTNGYRAWKLWLMTIPLACLITLPNALVGAVIIGIATAIAIGD